MNEAGNRKILKNSLGVGAATLLSRILGLVRVRLESTVLGGGSVASAWMLGFMLPNLLRRILGEGALGTALMPLVSRIEENEGVPEMRRKLAVVFTALSIVLALIVIVVSCGCLLLLKWTKQSSWAFFQHDYVRVALELQVLLMPYAFFICLVGVIGAVVNYAGIFVRAALASLLLNIFLIAGLAAGWLWAMPEYDLLKLLSVLTPASGVVQLALLLWLLKKCGRFPVFCRQAFASLGVLKELWRLMLPGVIAGGALQLSFLVDQGMAASVGSQAVPALNYVYRLVDLPIGLFAVSLGSVLMATMSKAAAKGCQEELGDQLIFSLRQVWFICLPLAFAVIFFHEPMLRVLCVGGRYSESDLEAAKMVAIFYGSGIPLFCSLKVILPAFYARKEMKKPLYVSLCAISVNIALNYILKGPLKQSGIALATVIASLLNNGLLLWMLKREGFDLCGKKLAVVILRTTLIAGGLALIIYAVYSCCLAEWAKSRWYCGVGVLAGIGLCYGAGYFLLSMLCRAGECGELIPLLLRKNKKR